MSPRRNRPKGARGDDPAPLRVPDFLVGAPSGWQVRTIAAANARKAYVCPGCNHTVPIGTAHVVAWRDDEEDLRRHWHTPCWKRDHGRG